MYNLTLTTDVITEFCQENIPVIANTFFQKHKRQLYTWTTPMVNTKIRLSVFVAAKEGGTLYRQQKKILGADCGSDHQLLIVTFRLKLKKIEKMTRPFRYDLN